jgi:hypothetical protein
MMSICIAFFPLRSFARLDWASFGQRGKKGWLARAHIDAFTLIMYYISLIYKNTNTNYLTDYFTRDTNSKSTLAEPC